jgi:hypothetical protein
MAWLHSEWAAGARLLPNITWVGNTVGKATARISLFLPESPLLSYNMCKFPKFCWLHLSLPPEQVLCCPAKNARLIPGLF